MVEERRSYHLCSFTHTTTRYTKENESKDMPLRSYHNVAPRSKEVSLMAVEFMDQVGPYGQITMSEIF
jgi:hypothetical protein